jgi:D-hydroxyproline dehydrogenase subunit alpha
MQQNGQHARVAIVGAGPAGLSAAATLARHGIPTTLIDEGHGLGGQYYKHYSAAPGLSRGRELDDLHRIGASKSAALRTTFAEIRTDTLVWGFFPPRRLALLANEDAAAPPDAPEGGPAVEMLEPDAVLFASGALERVAAFPGWTLPGVMTAGGAQRLLSHEGILPGDRFVLAGTGPLLLAIATEIAEAGGEVAAVVDCVGLTEPVRDTRTALKAMRQPGRFRQWIDYRRALRRFGIPYFHNATVVEARGEGHVREVVIAQKDADWNIAPGSEQVIQADTLCLHYGFTAAVELPQLAGCRLDYDDRRSGWHVAHDADMRSTQPGLYVAGQLTGIGGADLAEATGELAALTIAHDLGAMDRATYRRVSAPVRDAVSRCRDFAEMLNRVYTPGPGIANLIRSDTLICRCEEVDAGQIDRAMASGGETLNGVKRSTRCGMGFCQGRICSQVLSVYLHGRHGVHPERSGVFNARLPLKPVPLGALATIPSADDGE